MILERMFQPFPRFTASIFFFRAFGIPQTNTPRLPITHGMVDWDCAESLSIPDMIKSLAHIHAEGTFPVRLPH